MQRIKKIFHLGKNLARSKTAIFTYMVFSGNVASAFLAFLFTVVLVRALSIAEFGYFSAFISLILLVSDLADIGIGSSLSTFLPRMEKTQEKLLGFLKTAFLSQTLIAVIISLIIFIFSSDLAQILFHGTDLAPLLRLTSAGIFFTIIANFFQYSLSARQKFLKVSLLSVFGSFIRLFLLGVIIFMFTVNLTNSVIIQVLALAILMIVAFLMLNFDFLKAKASLGDFKKLFSFTYLLGIAKGLTAIASRLDVLMIVALLRVSGPTEAGIYATASRVTSIYPLLTGSFSQVIAPRLSSTAKKSELRHFLIKVTLATIGLIATSVFFIIFSYPFMTLLFSAKGRLAASVFQILLISMIFFIGSIPSVSLAIYYLKKPHILTINSVLQLIIVIFGNLIFIPKYGRFGAAYSLILAYGITLLLTTILTFYYYKKHED